MLSRHLQTEDRISVKPHASQALHAINHLLGALAESYPPPPPEYGGLQRYPILVEDPDVADHSTDSVGIDATAPIWATLTRPNTHLTTGRALEWLSAPHSRPTGLVLQEPFDRTGDDAELRHRREDCSRTISESPMREYDASAPTTCNGVTA